MSVVYNTFEELYEEAVLPLKQSKPDYIRLDGNLTAGNRQVFGYFIYENHKWRINSDSHIEQLDKAYKVIQGGDSPFKFKATRSGNTCLELKDELASRPKHLFIYQC